MATHYYSLVLHDARERCPFMLYNLISSFHRQATFTLNWKILALTSDRHEDIALAENVDFYHKV